MFTFYVHICVTSYRKIYILGILTYSKFCLPRNTVPMVQMVSGIFQGIFIKSV